MTLKIKSLKSQQVWAFVYNTSPIVSISDSAIIHTQIQSPVISSGRTGTGVPTLNVKQKFYQQKILWTVFEAL